MLKSEINSIKIMYCLICLKNVVKNETNYLYLVSVLVVCFKTMLKPKNKFLTYSLLHSTGNNYL